MLWLDQDAMDVLTKLKLLTFNGNHVVVIIRALANCVERVPGEVIFEQFIGYCGNGAIILRKKALRIMLQNGIFAWGRGEYDVIK